MNFQNFWQSLKLDPLRRTKVVTFTTMVYNFFWSVGKILFGVFKNAFLYLLSGAYTLLLGFVKKIFISNHSKDINKETKSIVMGVLILISGVAFAVYAGTFFVFQPNFRFNLIWSIGIATCSFVELGIAIFNLVRVKRKNDIILTALRCCNFASALFAIVITQVALMNVMQAPSTTTYNGATGIVAGILAIAIGIFVVALASKKNTQKHDFKDKTQENIEKSDEILQILLENEEN